MSFRILFAAACVFPSAVLAFLLYFEVATSREPVTETNTAMRSRMCREHVELAITNPSDTLAKTAIEECIVAGYISQDEAKTAID